jgi:uncharacterized protein involved in exopolysaccharide biosynthesis
VRGPVRAPVMTRRYRISHLAALGVLLTVAGLLAGYIIGSSGSKKYAARAEVLYEISQERPTGFLREDRSLTTQLALLRSRSVLDAVATATSTPVEKIESALSVQLVGGSSEIIRVEVQDPSSAKALTMVTAIVDRYLMVTREQGTKEALAYLQERRDRLAQEITAKRNEINARPSVSSEASGDPRVAASQAELESLLTRADAVSTEMDKLTVGQRTQQRIEVLVPGYALKDPVGPKPLLATAGAGITAAMVAAFVVAFLGRRRAPR